MRASSKSEGSLERVIRAQEKKTRKKEQQQQEQQQRDFLFD